MRKKLMAFILICMMGILTACNSTELSFANQLKKVSNWNKVNLSQSGYAKIILLGEEMNIDFKTSGIIDQKELNGQMMIEISISLPESLQVELKEEKLDLIMDMYFEDGEVYINKSYFEQIIALSGMEMPEGLLNLDAKYIGFSESNEMIEAILGTTKEASSVDTLHQIYKEMGELLDLEIPIEKDGNTYEISLNKAQIIQLVESLADQVIQNLEVLNANYELGYNEEEIQEIQTLYIEGKQPFLDELESVLESVEMQLNYKVRFKNREANEEIFLELGMPELISYEIYLEQTTQKTYEAIRKQSGKKIELSQAELQALLMPPEPTYMIIDRVDGMLEIIEENEQVYVPAKEVLQIFEEQIYFDEHKKQTYAIVHGQEYKISDKLYNGQTYTSLETLAQIGYNISIDSQVIIIEE